MRLADLMFRQGHLSEQTLVDALMTGDRPAHLERCDLCADRAVALGRWLDDVRVVGLESADAAFPPEMLQAQQAQILRRIEQLEQPAARVIAFPRQSAGREAQGHGVAPGWVGVALAAGLVLGLIGGQLTARLDRGPAPVATAKGDITPASARPLPADVNVDDLLHQDLELISVPSLEGLDITPRLIAANSTIGG